MEISGVVQIKIDLILFISCGKIIPEQRKGALLRDCDLKAENHKQAVWIVPKFCINLLSISFRECFDGDKPFKYSIQTCKIKMMLYKL